MAHRSSLRASDADRDLVAERLRQAVTEGRLRPDEFEHRLGVALSASTYGELDPLVADLPTARVARRNRSSVLPWIPPMLALAIAIPVALLVLAAVVFVLTGVLAGWALWLFLGWWFFAGRRRGRNGRVFRGHPGGPYPVRRTQPRPDHWL
ncbi:MAG TPA: DUF1707 domain-containing protein [Solirubrobacteraceae bacterium]|nr:DUF1707 domain-containing protein [Solirubrobacteraceae bacterium]